GDREHEALVVIGMFADQICAPRCAGEERGGAAEATLEGCRHVRVTIFHVSSHESESDVLDCSMACRRIEPLSRPLSASERSVRSLRRADRGGGPLSVYREDATAWARSIRCGR